MVSRVVGELVRFGDLKSGEETSLYRLWGSNQIVVFFDLDLAPDCYFSWWVGWLDVVKVWKQDLQFWLGELLALVADRNRKWEQRCLLRNSMMGNLGIQGKWFSLYSANLLRRLHVLLLPSSMQCLHSFLQHLTYRFSRRFLSFSRKITMPTKLFVALPTNFSKCKAWRVLTNRTFVYLFVNSGCIRVAKSRHL